MRTLAIDQGTTSTRALVVDGEGRAELLFSRQHRQNYPRPGWVEHDPEELVASLRACLAAAGGVESLNAAGLANQGESCLAWEAGTGRALTPVIVWQDDRTAAAIERLRADGVEALALGRAGLPLDPYFSASKLGWIMESVPEARRLAERGRLRLGTTDAFFRERLTGRYETDVTTASRTSLMDLASCRWDPELCEVFGVPIGALPPIRESAGDLGALRCGEREVPLTASLVDQQAALYGHGCRRRGHSKITFGTGAFALTVTGPMVKAEGKGPLPTVAWQRAGEAPTYALDGGVYSASAAVNWARGIGLFGDLAGIEVFDAPPAIDRGIVFVPALAGLACPHWDRTARGAWFGLGLDTGPRDLVQAVLEGVALRMAEVVQSMAARVEIAEPIAIDGGMAANGYFCRFLADCLGREILVADQPEVTALGTAALAAEAAGRPFLLAREGRRILPGLDAGERRRRFAAARSTVSLYGAAVAP
jgi:glycerol kinase